MIRNAVVTVVVASVVAVVAPRDHEEAAMLLARAGVALIELALAIYPQEGYDAAPVDDESQLDNKVRDVADPRGSRRSAEYYPDAAMPQGRGCWVTHCEPLFDGYRHGERCYWRCPRRRAPSYQYRAPEPPQRYDPPAEQPLAAASLEDVPPEVLAILVLVGLITVAAIFSSFSSTSETDAIDADIAKTAELAAKLEDASREADAHLAAFLKDGFDGDDDRG